MAKKKTTKNEDQEENTVLTEAQANPTAGENLDFNAGYGDNDGIDLADHVDLGGIPDQTLVQPGDYLVTVKQAKAKKSRAGHPMINLELDVDMPDGTTSKVWDNLSLKPGKAQQITKQNLVKLGVSATFKGSVDALADELVGRSATASIVIRPASGEYDASNGVKRYSSVKATVTDLL